jgi:hypothetical protein
VALVDDIAAYLDARSTQFVAGTNLFINELPDTSEASLLVVTWPGSQQHVMGAVLAPVSEAMVTTFSRSTAPSAGTVPSSTAATRLMSVAYQSLTNVLDTTSTSSGRKLYAAIPYTDTYYAGQDERGRVCFEQKWTITHKPLSSD